jgi:hypothetical protein
VEKLSETKAVMKADVIQKRHSPSKGHVTSNGLHGVASQEITLSMNGGRLESAGAAAVLAEVSPCFPHSRQANSKTS